MIDPITGERRRIKGFDSAYKRMSWDSPAPTLTQNLQAEASDKKIHPSQNRTLSVYEGMILQTISDYDYKFSINGKNITANLKGLGVEVRFEKERINTFTADGEVMLSILASFAEQESVSLSQNLKWAVRKKYERGEVHAHLKLYGYRWESNERVIVPEEAEVVRFIFAEYMAGKSFKAIADELDAKGVKSVKQTEQFSPQSIRKIISNEEYTGCQILQQAYAHKPRKVKLNKGEMPMFRVDDHHEAIIDSDTFAAVQAMRKERGADNLHSRRNPKPYSGLFRCGKCGGRVDMHSTDHGRFQYWICECRVKHRCDVRNWNSKWIQAAIDGVLGEGLTEKQIKRQVKQILMFDNWLEFQMQNGRKIVWQKQ